MKRLISGLFLALVLSVSFQALAAEEGNKIDIFYNVKDIQIDSQSQMPENEKLKPFIYEGSTFVPLRYVIEKFNKQVEWEAETKTIHIQSDDKASEESNQKSNEGSNEKDNQESSEEEAEKNPINKEMKKFFNHLFYDFNEENIDHYIQHFHSSYLKSGNMRKNTESYLENFDVNTLLEDLKVIEHTENHLVVKTMEYMERTTDDIMQNQRVVHINILKKQDGQWKIFDVVQVEQERNVDE